MTRVLIVDDEILIRVGIKSCIDWASNGYEIIGLAEDGKQALDMIAEKRPQIVLTDIKMPNMDGLELIENIKQNYPQTSVIVLSCYNEIDFIKRAIKLGADDYILKLSMQPADLLKVLNNTKNEMDQKEVRLQQSKDLQTEISRKRNLLKEDLIKRAINDSISGEQLARELEKLGSDMSFALSGIIYAGIDDYTNASVRSRIEDHYLLKFSVTNIMEEILFSCCKGVIIEIEKGQFLIAVDYKGQPDAYGVEMEGFCRSVNNALKNYLNITMSFGISEPWRELNNFKIRYFQAKRALEQKFYYGRESIILLDKKGELKDELLLLNFNDEKLLVSSLENLDEKGAADIIDRFFGNSDRLKEYMPSKVRMAAVEILHSLIKVAKKFDVGEEFGPIASINGKNPVNMLMESEFLQDMKTWFGEFVDKLVDCISNKRLSTERPEILRLKKYISDNIGSEITLEKAARITNMNKSYLSSVFKKETGEAFTDYVNRQKMEEAKELIQRYSLKTYEAAERVGFQDESYFSKLFKKFIGISPSKIK